jgi:two-component system, NtrC family, sensor kinase
MTAITPGEGPARKAVRRADQSDDLSHALLEISSLLESAGPLDSVLRRIVEITAELMQMPICSIYLSEPDGTLRKRSNVGLNQDLSQQSSFKLDEGIPGWVARHGKLVALSDVTQDPRYASHPSPIMDPHAYICAPLPTKDRIIGVLSARLMRVKTFTRTECRVFQTVAQMIALVIDKQRLIEERVSTQHLAAVVTSLSEIAHYVKNVMFTEQIAEKTVGSAIENDPAMARIIASWLNLKRANRRIRKLVGDMLTYSRDRELEFEEVDLAAVVVETVNDLRDHALQRGVWIETDLDRRIGKVRLDPSVMADVLLNLITNAIDAIPAGPGGKVVVRTRGVPDRDRYVIEVEDNGAGIPAELRDKVFTLFFSTKGDQGTGIGLAATRKAAERHGGRIEFESQVGRGTVFRVELPRAPSAAVPSTGGPSP